MAATESGGEAWCPRSGDGLSRCDGLRRIESHCVAHRAGTPRGEPSQTGCGRVLWDVLPTGKPLKTTEVKSYRPALISQLCLAKLLFISLTSQFSLPFFFFFFCFVRGFVRKFCKTFVICSMHRGFYMLFCRTDNVGVHAGMNNRHIRDMDKRNRVQEDMIRAYTDPCDIFPCFVQEENIEGCNISMRQPHRSIEDNS